MGQRQVSRLLQIPRSTVQNIHKRFSEYGTVSHAQKSGRPIKMNERDQRNLCLQCRQKKCTGLPEIWLMCP